MGMFHFTTLTPTKPELLTAWVPSQPWAPESDQPLEVIGSYRIDDPAGQVGIEVYLTRLGETVLQVPLTYRNEPLAATTDADDALITTMQHSALGTRWVYDGLRDPLCIFVLAAVTMTGQGEALGMAQHEGRWVVVPSAVRIHGGGGTPQRVAIDGFARYTDDVQTAVFRNDGFKFTVHRRPTAGPRPPIALTATWTTQPESEPNPVVLAELQAL